MLPQKISMSNSSNLSVLPYLEKGFLQIAVKLRILKWDRFRLPGWDLNPTERLPWKKRRDTQKRSGTEEAALCDHGGRDWKMYLWDVINQLMWILPKLEEARNRFSPTACRGSAALTTSWFQILVSRTERIIFVVLSNSVCGICYCSHRKPIQGPKQFSFFIFLLFFDLIFGLLYLYRVLIKFFCSTKLLEVIFSGFLDCFLPNTVLGLTFACFSNSVFVLFFSTFLWLNWAALSRCLFWYNFNLWILSLFHLILEILVFREIGCCF